VKIATSRAVLAGSLLAMVSGFLLFDPTRRALLFYQSFLAFWPWLLLAVALVGLLQAMEDRAPLIFIGLLLTVAAIGLWGRPSLSWQSAVEAAPWLGVLFGTSLVMRATAGRRWLHLCAIVPRRIRAPREPLPPRTDLTCVAGVMYFDARSALAVDDPQVAINLIAGVTVLLVPREWQCQLVSARLRWTMVREDGPIPQTGPMLALKVSAFVGAFVIRRV
jgi:hypothetical protein